jgi:hypothetical protein
MIQALRDEVRRAYNRTTHFNEWIGLMQEWADLLDEFRKRPQRAIA